MRASECFTNYSTKIAGEMQTDLPSHLTPQSSAMKKIIAFPQTLFVFLFHDNIIENILELIFLDCISFYVLDTFITRLSLLKSDNRLSKSERISRNAIGPDSLHNCTNANDTTVFNFQCVYSSPQLDIYLMTLRN